MTKISDVLRRKDDRQPDSGHHVVTITPDSRVFELVALLGQRGIGAAVVSENGRTVTGIVSERDVVRALAGTPAGELMNSRVSDIMTSLVASTSPDREVDDVMAQMTTLRVRHVPVLVDGELAGLVSIGDVVAASIDELRHERDQLTAYITS